MTTLTIKKRLEAIEYRNGGHNIQKIFIHRLDLNPPIWEPEDPAEWKADHPNGRAILLARRTCRAAT
jgi:hypothetical protein